MSGPNTPGASGYVAAVAISDLVCAVLVLAYVTLWVGGGGAVAAVMFVPIMAVEVAVVGLPVALAGVAVLQLLCGRVRNQGVHVVVAAASGFLLSLAYARITGLGTAGFLTTSICLVVAISAGVGRASVIPLVRARRRRLAPDTVLRVP